MIAWQSGAARLAASVVCLVLLGVAVPAAGAGQGQDGQGIADPGGSRQEGGESTLIFYLDNDLFTGTDRYYTNAVKLLWISPDLEGWRQDPRLPEWAAEGIRALPAINRRNERRNVGFALGQDIYTPSDTQTKALVEDDRPYAGWLYFSLSLNSKTRTVLDTLELTLGVVGPWSGAEWAQKTVHRIKGVSIPEGWDNQLHNEPGVNLTYQRSWRALDFEHNSGLGLDVIPRAGATAGNVYTYANAGGEVRLGFHLPENFGTSVIRPGGGIDATPAPGAAPRSDYGIYLFAGVDGQAVARNIFLDGNTFKDSHHVAKKTFVANIESGVAAYWGDFTASYTLVHRTEEFYGQDGPQSYGSLALQYRF